MWLINRNKPEQRSDIDLIAAYRNRGDRKALGILFERYAHLVYGVCMKYLRNGDDSKDATLNIFEKVMKDLNRFEVQKFSYWIHSVARNYCLMQLRSRKDMIRVDAMEGSGWDGIDGARIQDEGYEKNTRESELSLLEDAIGQLSEDQRICIEMFYLKKFCYQDVAEIGGYTLNEVKSHIQNGKRNLKIYMTKKYHETTGH